MRQRGALGSVDVKGGPFSLEFPGFHSEVAGLPAVDPAYKTLERAMLSRKTGNRTESAALLAWFLGEIWRLDPEDVEDCICDGGGDKGIDGIHVDDDQRELVVFQSKYKNRPDKGQGDADLRDFKGTQVYFKSAAGIDQLLASSPNAELHALIRRLELRSKLTANPYVTSLVFVTNAFADPAGAAYRKAAALEPPALDLWTRERLGPAALRVEPPALVAARIPMKTIGRPLIAALDGARRMAVAVVTANEALGLPGLEDLSLFRFNVRLGLSGSGINRQIKETIDEKGEHRLFPAYHNGLTLITRHFDERADGLDLTEVSVVNGCQSLLALHAKRDRVTENLHLVVKVVEIEGSTDLAQKITYRSNNQNPISMRDLRATDAIQRDLRRDVAKVFGKRFEYAVRRGEERIGDQVLDSDRAAQLILAIWREEPWAAVRRTRLFDEQYHDIFKRDVDAYMLRAAYLVDEAVKSVRGREPPILPPVLESSFAAVRFTLCYLVALMARETQTGKAFFESPRELLEAREAAVTDELRRVAEVVVVAVMSFIEKTNEERKNSSDPADREPLDPKIMFKNRALVKAAAGHVTLTAKWEARQGRGFGAAWAAPPPGSPPAGASSSRKRT